MIQRSILLCAALLLASPCFAQVKETTIASHIATYRMSLGKAKSGSGISSVTGLMTFDWQDACDGWAIQQNMQLRFLYSEGEETQVSSPAVTWESKDGKAFNFHVKRIVGDQEDEAFQGRVKRDDQGRGIAHYTTPLDKRDIEVDSRTVFPTMHTLHILEKALSGEKMFTQRVFDGADAEGAVDISTFIGTKLEGLDEVALVPEVRGSKLLTKTAWPVRLAFYKPGSDGSEPDYEMDILLQPNGVARSIAIDYGDFMINGTLMKLEPEESLGCTSGHKAS